LTKTQMGLLPALVLLCLGLSSANGAAVPLAGKHLGDIVTLTEGRLPYPPLSTVGVVRDPVGAPVGHLEGNHHLAKRAPGGHLEGSHHLAKRAPQRYYGYRGYNRGYRSRGGGGNNRARTAVLFGKTALTAGAAGVALCLAFNCGK